jgi:HK97 gp10 family phage protein
MKTDAENTLEFMNLKSDLRGLSGDAKRGSKRSLEESGDRIKSEAKDIIGRSNAQATHALENSIQKDVKKDLIRDGGKLHLTVGSPLKYAKYVEFGTGIKGDGRFRSPSSMPPRGPIITWIRNKGVSNKKTGLLFDEMVFKIRKSIRDFGTPEQPFLRPAFHKEVSSGRLRASLEKEVRQEIRD